MTTLYHTDYETRSTCDLSVHGLDRYVTDPGTEVILAAYAEGDHKPKLWEPHRGPIPAELREAMEDPCVTMVAWNATFERLITRYVLGITKPIEEWADTMVGARYLSLPGSLEDVGRILEVKQQKLEEGARLIKKFCEPAVEGGKTTLFGISKAAYQDWNTDPADWDLFCKYVLQDVESEQGALRKLRRFPLPPQEQRTWVLDQKINERGVPTDMPLVTGADWMAKVELESLTKKLFALTNLENPNSRDQFLAWIQAEGYTFNSLGKSFVMRALGGECQISDAGREALELRKLTAKTSIHKYSRIADMVSPDGRLRHQYAFMGASRTGRWSGKGAGEAEDAGGVQLQNLSRPIKAVEKKMDLASDLVRKMDIEGVRQEFGSVLDVVVSVVRASIKADPGHRLVVSDLNAVENRGLGYLARCNAILDVFRKGRDPYLDFASKLYGIPYEVLYAEWKAGDSTKRTGAKPGTLGCGYGLSGGEECFLCDECKHIWPVDDAIRCPECGHEDFDRMWTGLLGYGRSMGIALTKEEADRSVKVFRDSFPEVVHFWYDMESAAIHAIRNPGQPVPVLRREDEERGLKARISFRCVGKSVLCMDLPSGRALHYIRPRVEETKLTGKNGQEYTKEGISFEGINQKTKQWGVLRTYGSKLVENATQALCRDALAVGLHRAEDAGFEVLGHSHDEEITQVPEDSPLGPDDLSACMSAPMPWAGEEFPLGAEGWTGISYRKN